MADFEGTATSTIAAPTIGAEPSVAAWLTPTSGVVLAGSAVSQWTDQSAVAWFESAASGTLEFSGDVVSTMPSLTSSGLGWIPVVGDIISTFAPFEASGSGRVDTVASTMPAFASAASGRVFYISRPDTWQRVVHRGKRVKRIYIGSTLIKQFPVGNLFDADGNPLSLELADGTPVTLELS